MGFASGGVSFRRYHISGPHAKGIDEVVDALKEHAFGKAETVSADGVETGWIAPTHLFDTQIDASKIAAGQFLHLAMRTDKLTPPPAVVRSYRQIEEQAALEASGREKLTKEERRQAKEAAEARAQKEARKGLFRRISAHPVLLDLNNHVVYFGSLGSAANDKLRLLFAASFGATLDPMDAGEVASRFADNAGKHRSYEDARPAHLVEAPAGGGNGSASVDETDRTFLGREFLTWLWHRVATGDGTVSVSADGKRHLPAEVGLVFDKVLQLDCDFQVTGRDAIYSDGPTATPEARAALRVGKQPCRAGLLLAAGPDEYSLVLDASRWQVSSLNMPASEEMHPAARLEERCQHIVRLCAVLDGLYASFLNARFGGRFASQWGKIRKWAANGQQQADHRGAVSEPEAPLRLAK